jgi:hypothetical protein
MLKFGLKQNGEFQIVNDAAVLPAVCLNPFSHRTNRYFITSETYSIHHFAGSWVTKAELEKHRSGNLWNDVFNL